MPANRPLTSTLLLFKAYVYICLLQSKMVLQIPCRSMTALHDTAKHVSGMFGVTDRLALVCKVSAYRRAKSRLGVGKEDKFSYGQSVGPSGVIAVDVPNYQHQAQRQQALQQTRTVRQPAPQLPTPFAAAQVPLPDDDEGPGGNMFPSRAGSIPLTDHAKTIADIAGGAAAKRSSTPLQRRSLVPGQAYAAPVTTRLGSAPPGIKRFSLPGIRPGSSMLPLHRSAPGLGNLFPLVRSACTKFYSLRHRCCAYGKRVNVLHPYENPHC